MPGPQKQKNAVATKRAAGTETLPLGALSVDASQTFSDEIELTKAERAVAVGLVVGLTDREIAKSLGQSVIRLVPVIRSCETKLGLTTAKRLKLIEIAKLNALAGS